MRKLLFAIASIGIKEDTSFDLRNKLRVFNNATLVIFFISMFYTVIGVANEYYLAVGLTFFSVFSNILALVLIQKGYYKFAFHYTMWYAFVFLTAFSVLFGGANNSYYYFLFMPVACNILFDSLKVTLFYLFSSAFLMVYNVYFIETYEPYYQIEGWMRLFSYPNVLFAVMLVFLGVRLFKQENIKYAHQIEEQKEILEEKNQEITDSINYAKKIQSALIPSEQEFNSFFRDSFVFFKPKDIVSGDFYWVSQKGNKVFYVTADCTGHGVPGGFMTMLGMSFLDQIINEKEIAEPAEVLNLLRDRIIHTLKQTGTAGESKDGMDVVLCCIDRETNTLHYAAANNSLYLFRNKEFIEYKPDKQPCGFYHELKPFTAHEVKLQTGDCIFTFTDGYADQFGGPKGKKFKYKQLEEMIVSMQDKSFVDQRNVLEEAFEGWRGNLEQIDDVCIIGVRI